MSQDKPLIHQIRQAIAQGHQAKQASEQQRDSRAQALAEQESREAEERAAAVIAQIPACISCHFGAGRTYGRIMRLRYDESTEDPRWLHGYWDKVKPNPNKLLKAAWQVYYYCHQHQLKPYLVRDMDFYVQKHFLYIGINCSHHLESTDGNS